MTILKLTSSKKAILVIDDEGNAFITSLEWMKSLIDGSNKNGFILLSRLPDKVSVTRFKKSPLYGEKLPQQKQVAASVDALSVARKAEKHEEQLFSDKQVW